MDVQNSLVAKLSHGEPLDSMSGADPVSTTSQRTDQGTETVYTYADGSIVASSVEQPPVQPASQTSTSGITPLSVTKCVATASNAYQITYQGCDVAASNGITQMHFEAGYTAFNGSSRIDYANNYYSYVAGGTKSNESLSITRKTQSGSLPATARYKLTMHIAVKGQPVIDGDQWIQLNVLNAQASETHYL